MMDFTNIAGGIMETIRAGCTWRGFKWRRASETQEDKDCAVFHMDIDIKPGTISSLSIFMGLMKIFKSPGKRPDTDHSFFQYLKEQSDKEVDAEVRVVVRLEPRPEQPEPEVMPNNFMPLEKAGKEANQDS